jgi:uncharacterized protein (DUF433 family)
LLKCPYGQGLHREKRGEGYYVVGKRVSLDSIIYTFLDGYSAESIIESFPSLSLEEVYGGIAFYLANRAQMDEYLREGEREFVRLRNESRAKNPALYERLRSMLEGKRSVKS